MQDLQENDHNKTLVIHLGRLWKIILTVKKAAKYLKKSPSTVRRLIRSRKLRATKLAGKYGVYVIDRSDLLEFMMSLVMEEKWLNISYLLVDLVGLFGIMLIQMKKVWPEGFWSHINWQPPSGGFFRLKGLWHLKYDWKCKPMKFL